MLYEDGHISRTLTPEELEKLFTNGRIYWPTISEREIQDKSKGDYFAKGFAILQTTWFIIQCIVRRVYGLDISQLEIITVAFAALNGVVYALWWDKPVDVACPVPVHILPHIPSRKEFGIQTNDQYYSENDNALILFPKPPTTVLEKSGTDPASVTKIERESSSAAEPRSCSSTLGRIWSYVWRKLLPWTLLYNLIYKPVLIIMFDLQNMVECKKMDLIRSPLSVPTFYAPRHSQSLYIIGFIGVILSTIFGGIHCTPWWFFFPSIREQLLWRACAIIITAAPLVFFVFLTVTDLLENDERPLVKPIFAFAALFWIPIGLAYFVARGVLLVLPFLALRSLPSGSFLDFNWSAIIPHI